MNDGSERGFKALESGRKIPLESVLERKRNRHRGSKRGCEGCCISPIKTWRHHPGKACMQNGPNRRMNCHAMTELKPAQEDGEFSRYADILVYSSSSRHVGF